MYIKSILIIFYLYVIISSCSNIKRVTKVTTVNAEIIDSILHFSGEFIDIDENGISEYGHCWSLDTNITIEDNRTVLNYPSQPGIYYTTPKNMILDTTYYYRSYAINEDGQVLYGTIKSFYTNQADFNILCLTPIIVNSGQLNLDGILQNPYGVKFIEYGHIIKDGSTPTLNDQRTNFGETNNNINFNSSFNNLLTGRNYHLIAYGITEYQELIYSNEVQVTIPEYLVRTDTAYSSTQNQFVFQGTVLSIGVDPIIEHGHCWSSTTSTPTINHQKISLGPCSQTGVFNSTLNNIINNTTIYYRAYIIYSNQIIYGQVKRLEI
jgi:hypothetical protein